jgi:hypothetical protein
MATTAEQMLVILRSSSPFGLSQHMKEIVDGIADLVARVEKLEASSQGDAVKIPQPGEA